MDNLADAMQNKWSYNVEQENMESNQQNNDDILKKTDMPSNITHMQRHSYSTLAQPSVNVYSPLDNTIDNSTINDYSISKDDQIINLKQRIQEILDEKEDLMQQNKKLKDRISELRKTLNKAQQYRRKSSIAV